MHTDKDDLADFFRQQKNWMEYPEEDIAAYIARRAMRRNPLTPMPGKRSVDSSLEETPIVLKRPRVSGPSKDTLNKADVAVGAADRQSTNVFPSTATAAVHELASKVNTCVDDPINSDTLPEDVCPVVRAISSTSKPSPRPLPLPCSHSSSIGSILRTPGNQTHNVPIDIAQTLSTSLQRDSIDYTLLPEIIISSKAASTPEIPSLSTMPRQDSISIVSHQRTSKELARSRRVINTVPKQRINAADASNVTTPTSTPIDASMRQTGSAPLATGIGSTCINKKFNTNITATTSGTTKTRSKPNIRNTVASSKTSKHGQPTLAKQNLPKKVPARTLAKQKLPKMTPPEYAEVLIAKYSDPNRKTFRGVRGHLRGKRIFYTGGDLNYAVESTRNKMEIILKHGGTLVSKYDPEVVTHIVTDAKARATAKDLGLNSILDIPMHIPTVEWSWIDSMIRTKPVEPSTVRGKLGDHLSAPTEYWRYAAFSERMDAGDDVSWKNKSANRGNGWGQTRRSDPDYSHISEFTENPNDSDYKSDESDRSPPSPEQSKKATPAASQKSILKEDPLAEFYAQAKADVDAKIGWEMEDSGSDDDEPTLAELAPSCGSGSKASTWTCNKKTEQPRIPSPNQDIIDKLKELRELHKAKPGTEHSWRAFSYSKSLRSIIHYPTRIKSFAEARSIRNVGEKTALKATDPQLFHPASTDVSLKIMEIIATGELRRIEYENTDDVRVNKLFQGIFGVGMKTAYTWYANGARTLEDVVAGKGGIKLTGQQEIGIRFYIDINERMPRSEAEDIFKKIKRIALKIDPKLFIQIMGSFRRGAETCGDIDILITRPVDDGKTHAGVVRKIWQECHAQGVITEDLVMPDDFNELEVIYRGLCRRDKTSKRRRLDFLSVPWGARGAALLYYTGDAIFNRSLRLKARKNGMSLNQRGLFSGVVRSYKDKSVKAGEGILLAAETEEEIFKILNVPWQEPCERVRADVI